MKIVLVWSPTAIFKVTVVIFPGIKVSILSSIILFRSSSLKFLLSFLSWTLIASKILESFEVSILEFKMISLFLILSRISLIFSKFNSIWVWLLLTVNSLNSWLTLPFDNWIVNATPSRLILVSSSLIETVTPFKSEG
jgi:hypothetical protein